MTGTCHWCPRPLRDANGEPRYEVFFGTLPGGGPNHGGGPTPRPRAEGVLVYVCLDGCEER